mmetsp:Transcript_13528/g.56633  ORF Transcript_13528/g.56633 Transcript_13528/m.56633 type:complete len:227 (+) Transcript_13528:405-1085(+)
MREREREAHARTSEDFQPCTQPLTVSHLASTVASIASRTHCKHAMHAPATSRTRRRSPQAYVRRGHRPLATESTKDRLSFLHEHMHASAHRCAYLRARIRTRIDTKEGYAHEHRTFFHPASPCTVSRVAARVAPVCDAGLLLVVLGARCDGFRDVILEAEAPVVFLDGEHLQRLELGQRAHGLRALKLVLVELEHLELREAPQLLRVEPGERVAFQAELLLDWHAR